MAMLRKHADRYDSAMLCVTHRHTINSNSGNTVFLALGASDQPITRPYGWLKSLISILFFMLGCLIFIQIRKFGSLKRGTLGFSFLIQTLCIFIAAALVQSDAIQSYNSFRPTLAQESMHFNELIPLALLAFQSGGQMAASRLLGLGEVPTTVLTSVYCDFITDQKLLSGPAANVKRNRRFGAITMFLIGAICGGWLTRSSLGLSVALWISGGIKLIITLAWFFWTGAETSAV